MVSLEANRICPARNARSAGEIIWAGRLQPQKPEAQPRPRQDSQTDKDALGRTTPGRSHGRLGIPPLHGFTGSPPGPGKGHPQRLARTPQHPAAAGIRRGVEAHLKASRRVREPSFVTTRQRTASVGDGTHSCNLPQQAPAYLPAAPAPRVGALIRPIRRSPVRWYRGGTKRSAVGRARRAFPWRQAKRAAPQARRREGLKPNGRDGIGGTGSSPKARRRCAPTRPTMTSTNSEAHTQGSTDGRKAHP